MPADEDKFDLDLFLDLTTTGQEKEALAYIGSWINKGSVPAMISMATYLKKRGRDQESLEWMRRAENSIGDEDVYSLLTLSSAYMSGLGDGTREERRAKARTIRESVAESGNIHVIHEMMSEYLYGLNGAPQDHERFIYWAKQAAAQGSKEAIRVLRECGGDPGKVHTIKRLFR